MTSYLELARLHKLLALSYRLTTEFRQSPEISLCYFGPFAFFVYYAMVEQATVWEPWTLVSWISWYLLTPGGRSGRDGS